MGVTEKARDDLLTAIKSMSKNMLPVVVDGAPQAAASALVAVAGEELSRWEQKLLAGEIDSLTVFYECLCCRILPSPTS